MKEQSKLDPALPTRKTKILSVKSMPASEFFLAPITHGNKNPTIETENRVTILVEKQIGLDDPIVETYIVEEHAAEEFVQKLETADFDNKPRSVDLKEFDEAGNDLNQLFSVNMDGFFPDCYKALYDAGVINQSYDLKAEVLEGFSVEKIDWAKSKDAENWELILETEYVLNNFPYYSLASYAVRIFYNYFIAYNDESVAYLWREMKMVQNQEPLALKYEETKGSAGDGGGKASHSNKKRRLENLLNQMELIVIDNDVLREMNPIICAQAALKRAVSENENLWTQGQGQLEQYLTILSSDSPYKEKFDALFHNSA